MARGTNGNFPDLERQWEPPEQGGMLLGERLNNNPVIIIFLEVEEQENVKSPESETWILILPVLLTVDLE